VTRTVRLVLTAVLAAGAVAILVLVSRDDAPRVATTATPGAPTTGCAVPADGAVEVPERSVARDARVAVPGSTEIETHGFVVGTVVGDGVAVVTDPTASAVLGQVGTIEGDALTTVVPVIDGCTIAAIASGPTGVWAATCDPDAAPDATAGAELVLVEGSRPTRRIALPTGCVGELAVGDTAAWVTNVALSRTPARLWRVDLATSAVSEPTALGETTVAGVAATPDSVWTLRRGVTGAVLVRNAASDGSELAVVPADRESIVGVAGDRLWTQDLSGASLVERDASTGAVVSTSAIPDLRSAATSANGTWFTQAGTDSLDVAVGSVDGTEARSRVTFTGVGPDRAGLPLLPTLSATGRGAWLGYQNRLFLLPG
jgi:hypothetical protein